MTFYEEIVRYLAASPVAVPLSDVANAVCRSTAQVSNALTALRDKDVVDRRGPVRQYRYFLTDTAHQWLDISASQRSGRTRGSRLEYVERSLVKILAGLTADEGRALLERQLASLTTRQQVNSIALPAMQAESGTPCQN